MSNQKQKRSIQSDRVILASDRATYDRSIAEAAAIVSSAPGGGVFVCAKPITYDYLVEKLSSSEGVASADVEEFLKKANASDFSRAKGDGLLAYSTVVSNTSSLAVLCVDKIANLLSVKFGRTSDAALTAIEMSARFGGVNTVTSFVGAASTLDGLSNFAAVSAVLTSKAVETVRKLRAQWVNDEGLNGYSNLIRRIYDLGSWLVAASSGGAKLNVSIEITEAKFIRALSNKPGVAKALEAFVEDALGEDFATFSAAIDHLTTFRDSEAALKEAINLAIAASDPYFGIIESIFGCQSILEQSRDQFLQTVGVDLDYYDINSAGLTVAHNERIGGLRYVEDVSVCAPLSGSGVDEASRYVSLEDDRPVGSQTLGGDAAIALSDMLVKLASFVAKERPVVALYPSLTESERALRCIAARDVELRQIESALALRRDEATYLLRTIYGVCVIEGTFVKCQHEDGSLSQLEKCEWATKRFSSYTKGLCVVAAKYFVPSHSPWGRPSQSFNVITKSFMSTAHCNLSLLNKHSSLIGYADGASGDYFSPHLTFGASSGETISSNSSETLRLVKTSTPFYQINILSNFFDSDYERWRAGFERTLPREANLSEDDFKTAYFNAVARAASSIAIPVSGGTIDVQHKLPLWRALRALSEGKACVISGKMSAACLRAYLGKRSSFSELHYSLSTGEAPSIAYTKKWSSNQFSFVIS